jgi:retron-type reverse transcriptase
LKYDYRNGAFSRHLGTCTESAGMRVTKLELITAFQNQNILLQSVHIVGGIARLWNLKNSKAKHSKLIDIVGDPNVLIMACEIIKLKFGNMAYVAKKSQILNSINEGFIKKVASRILNSCFKFKNVRRVEVFKPTKQFLVVGNFRDKVVQQVISMILEQIFEARFLRISHGFRAAKGCHSALKQIRCE